MEKNAVLNLTIHVNWQLNSITPCLYHPSRDPHPPPPSASHHFDPGEGNLIISRGTRLPFPDLLDNLSVMRWGKYDPGTGMNFEGIIGQNDLCSYTDYFILIAFEGSLQAYWTRRSQSPPLWCILPANPLPDARINLFEQSNGHRGGTATYSCSVATQ